MTVSPGGFLPAVSVPEGSSNSVNLATFTDSNTSDTAADFSASVNWGDGAISTGTVTGGNGSFTVSGSHVYADERAWTGSVTIADPTHTTTYFTEQGTITVTEGDSLAPQGDIMRFAVQAGQTFSRPLAVFTDTDTSNTPADFTATLEWGDLTPVTAGTVTGGNGSFTVSGSHAYMTQGSGSVHVTIADDAPGSAADTYIAAVNVNAVPFDLNGDVVSDFVFQNDGAITPSAAGTPQIWLWNGTSVTGEATFANPGASWHIVASRDFNADGMADLVWQDDSGAPGIWLMNGTTPLTKVGLADPGPSWRVVAAGNDQGDARAELFWQNTDGTLGVWLMSGTRPVAEAGLVNPGSNWKVVGAADFNGDGNDDILLQDRNTGNLMIDLMNGTTIASTVSITVGDPSWHAVSIGDFNGQAEIAWQNSNGQPGIWLMNGTTPVAEQALFNPALQQTGWQVVSIDHFTPNQQADLLFQNTGGGRMLWEMNGASVASVVDLGNDPGSEWQSVNGHPFAAG
jgi:hypothetical protein